VFRDAFLKLKEQVETACDLSGRPVGSVMVLPVTKTIPVVTIREAHQDGFRNFGESRVQELFEKKSQLPADIHWHFIGHLQTNKVKKLMGEVALIHSLDSLRLAACISSEAQKKNWEAPVLLEVNTSGESSKSGFEPGELERVLDNLQKLPRIRFKGLMTIGPLTEDRSARRRAFADLRKLKERLVNRFQKNIFTELSMGMSQDFADAIEEGATIIRIGTLLFGERTK